VVAVKRRRLHFIALLLTVAIAAAVLSQLVLGGSERVQIGNGSVSALARASTEADALPSNMLAYPFAARNFASRNGEGSRLLRVEGTLRLFAVPGKEGMLCLIEVDDTAGTAGGACADRHILLTGSIYMADRQEDGSQLVLGLVGDGHTYAEAEGRRVPVRSNAFVLPGVAGSTVKLGSPTAEQTIDLGG
jgi:hypothetical protein